MPVPTSDDETAELKERLRRAEESLRKGHHEDARGEFDAIAGSLPPGTADAIVGRVLRGRISARSALAGETAECLETAELERTALSLAELPGLNSLVRDGLLSSVAYSALTRGDVDLSLTTNRRILECGLEQGESGDTLRARLALAQACFERGILEEASIHFRAIVDLLNANPHFVSRPEVAARYKAVSYLRMGQAFRALGEPDEARREAHEGLEVLTASDPKNAKLREELELLLGRF